MTIVSVKTAILLLLLFVISFQATARINLLLNKEGDLQHEKEQQLLTEVATRPSISISSSSIHSLSTPTSTTSTTLTPPPGNNNTTFSIIIPTLDCPTFFPEAKAGHLGFEDPNLGIDPVNYTRFTVDDPKFQIAIHNRKFDTVRWGIMQYGKYYERALVKIWRQVLMAADDDSSNTQDEMIVLDVGGNIGYFSLLSLSLSETTKHRIRVHTFEPNPINNLRHCESLQLNEWHHPDAQTKPAKASIVIHPIGVSDQNSVMTFVPETNPGASYFAKSEAQVPQVNRGGRTTQIMVVTLDNFAHLQGWLGESSDISSRRPTIAILKIDVEALEAEVVLGAKQLITSRLVKNIFMEVTVRTDSHFKACEQALDVIVHAGYHLAGQGGYSGPGHTNPWPDDEQLVSNILTAAHKEKSNQLNLWWVLSA